MSVQDEGTVRRGSFVGEGPNLLLGSRGALHAFKEKLERQDSEVAVQNSLKTKDIAQQQRLLYFFGGGGGGGGVANFSGVLGQWRKRRGRDG